MKEPSDRYKLRILLPHWIEHNAEHAAEFRHWAEKANETSSFILEAAAHVESANLALESALKRLGGALDFVPDHHHE